MSITREQRQELAQAKVTLNGKRATICGTLNKFATVAQVPAGLSYEWAWSTVARIVANGGGFTAE